MRKIAENIIVGTGNAIPIREDNKNKNNIIHQLYTVCAPLSIAK